MLNTLWLLKVRINAQEILIDIILVSVSYPLPFFHVHALWDMMENTTVPSKIIVKLQNKMNLDIT